ncbi:MAG TPA: hypothetical protein PKH65_06440 [Bacteroidia bacterium]|nr:hypothetical protein [Bacteroidia bacterium]HNT80305.1 hypothetical protein [Bacteroidia bacterium]
MEDQKHDFEKEQDSKKAIVIVVITILLAVNGLLLWQFFDKKSHLEEVTRTLEATASEKDALSAELQRMKNEYEKINQENASLQSRLQLKDEEIKSKIAEIQRLINSGDAAKLKQAREELANLKTMNANLMAQMDSLKVANQNLSNENQNLNVSLTEERGRVASLSEQNNQLAGKVAKGSVLRTAELSVNGVRFKSSGKESETNRASSVQKIKTCFKIIENQVADRGTKDLYLRVLSPDGAVMSTSTETFLYNGQATLYTAKEAINYDNKDTDVCIYWGKGSSYSKGKHIIEIYCEGNMIGSSAVEFK